MQTIIQQLEVEILRLSSAEYRKQQEVWLEDRNLRHLKKLLGTARSLRKPDVNTFCRYVADIAAPTSHLMQLASKFYPDASSSQ